MKMSRIFALVLVIVMALSCFAGCKPAEEEKKVAPITIWVSEVEGSVALTQKQVDAFLAAHPEYKYEIKIESVSEADAATQVLADVSSAPDIYCFAQDQLARLVQAGALNQPGKNAANAIKSEHDAASINAATVGSEIYAYPLTSDNGYFLYYDKSIVTNPDSLEDIIAACEDAGKKFAFEIEGSGWYTASFFFGAGCHSTWTTDDEGNFTGVNDNFNSPEGLVAMKGMQKLTHSTAYLSGSKIVDGIAAVVSGTWIANDAIEYFGDNMGVTDLPSFNVDGKDYHLGSFSGTKLMGVKNQADVERVAFCHALAAYLTGETCQLERYETLQWGPSNLKAQDNDDVKNNVILGALAAQGQYAIPQGQIHGKWWDMATALAATSRTCDTAAELQAALDNYKHGIDGLFK